MGRRIWVANPEYRRPDGENRDIVLPAHTFDCRVMSIKQFLPADSSINREKHLVQIVTDPGGIRTLSVGCIKLKDPRRVAAALARQQT